jgi:hypothetical protein
MRFGFGRGGQMVCPLLCVWRSCLGFFFVATLLITGCSRSQSSQATLNIDHEVSPLPAHVGPVTVTLRLSDGAAKPVPGAHIKIEADMTHAGMAPAFGEAKEIEPGRYESLLTLQMAGDWVVLLHIVLSDGTKLEREFNVPGVQPN